MQLALETGWTRSQIESEDARFIDDALRFLTARSVGANREI